MSDNWFEAAFGSHYPLLYQHRDQAEAGRCLEQLEAMVPLGGKSSAPILDLGCGDGRHLEILSGQGRRVVGLDLSLELLELARNRPDWTSPTSLARGDMRQLPFGPGSFSAVLSLFTAFGYFGSPEANEGPVREIAAVLAPAGHWYLDYFDGDAVRAELGDGKERDRRRVLEPLEVIEKRRFLADRSVVSKRVQLFPLPGREADAARFGVNPGGVDYTEEVAVFTLDQLTSLAEAHGLELVATAGGYEGEALGAGSRWILVFRKTSKALSI